MTHQENDFDDFDGLCDKCFDTGFIQDNIPCHKCDMGREEAGLEPKGMAIANELNKYAGLAATFIQRAIQTHKEQGQKALDDILDASYMEILMPEETQAVFISPATEVQIDPENEAYRIEFKVSKGCEIVYSIDLIQDVIDSPTLTPPVTINKDDALKALHAIYDYALRLDEGKTTRKIHHLNRS